MSHQPFETWNLDRTNLTPEQQDELERHVASCHACRQTRMAWDAIQQEIKYSEQKKAPVGFAVRFRSNLEERRKLEHRRQVRKMLIILCASIALILTILVINFIATTPPAAWIGSAIRTVANVPFNLQELFYIVTFWISRVPPLVIFAVSAVPLLWLMVLIVTGAMTYFRFHHEGEVIR